MPTPLRPTCSLVVHGGGLEAHMALSLEFGGEILDAFEGEQGFSSIYVYIYNMEVQLWASDVRLGVEDLGFRACFG